MCAYSGRASSRLRASRRASAVTRTTPTPCCTPRRGSSRPPPFATPAPARRRAWPGGAFSAPTAARCSHLSQPQRPVCRKQRPAGSSAYRGSAAGTRSAGWSRSQTVRDHSTGTPLIQCQYQQHCKHTSGVSESAQENHKQRQIARGVTSPSSSSGRRRMARRPGRCHPCPRRSQRQAAACPRARPQTRPRRRHTPRRTP